MLHSEALIQYLDSESWPYTIDPGSGVVRFAYQGDHGTLLLSALVRDEQEQIIVYGLPDLIVAEDRLGALLELITRINFGLFIGNFEMDLNEGDMRFKVSVDTEDQGASMALTRNAIASVCRTVDYYLPAIATTLAGASAIASLGALELEEEEEEA